MAKKEKVAEKAPEAVKQPETTPEETPEETKAKQPGKGKQTSFTVYKNGNVVRTYSLEDHGEDAGDLAEEYAKKIGGEVR